MPPARLPASYPDTLDPLVRDLLVAGVAYREEHGLGTFDEVGHVAAREQADLFSRLRQQSFVPADVAAVERGTVAGRPALVVTPLADPVATVLHLHGGGWVVGSLEGYEHHARRLSADLSARVVSLDYRLAPEDPFPAAVDDAWAALQELASGVDRLAVAGDSAGGNLAAVVARRARDAGIALLGQLLVYPGTSNAREMASYTRFGDGFGLDRTLIDWFVAAYLPDPADRSHPDASPLEAADLSGVAPAVVTVADHDPLVDEGTAYAEALQAAGVETTLVVARGQVHGYESLAPLVPAAEEAVVASRAAMRALLTRGLTA